MTPSPSAARVVDASVLVAALVDGRPAGAWAAETIRGRFLVGPAHLPAGVKSVLRRLSASGAVAADLATLDGRLARAPGVAWAVTTWAP